MYFNYKLACELIIWVAPLLNPPLPIYGCGSTLILNTDSSVFGVMLSPCAGLVDTMNDTFRNGWHQNSIEYEVDGEPISEILNKSNIEYIDLITIDVEGGEEVVLKTFDFKIPIYVVCIELDEHNPEKDERCRAILIENGFTFNKRFLINEFWINNNYFRKDLLYDKAIEKKTFKDSIFEIGHFPYLERGLIPEIENIISHSIP